jgi:hypothetical protein
MLCGCVWRWCWPVCCVLGTRVVSVFIVLISDVLVVCRVRRLTCSCGCCVVRVVGVGCVSGTGVGPFVVVLGAGVGGVSVFVVVFVRGAVCLC